MERKRMRSTHKEKRKRSRFCITTRQVLGHGKRVHLIPCISGMSYLIPSTFRCSPDLKSIYIGSLDTRLCIETRLEAEIWSRDVWKNERIRDSEETMPKRGLKVGDMKCVKGEKMLVKRGGKSEERENTERR